MKKIILQLFRSIVTIVIMSMMAVMIFSLRSKLTKALAIAKDANSKLALAYSEIEELKKAQDKGVYVLCRFDLNDNADINDYTSKTLSVVPQVRAENGCRLYTLLKDADTDWEKPMRFGQRTYWMVEKWDSIEALKAHIDAPHMKAFGPTVRDMRKNATFHVLEPVVKTNALPL